MAADIIPIQLGLTRGDVYTLWAPTWEEDGETWEAFLGHDDDLYAFDTAAELAAFMRSDAEHDLTDHPAWSRARQALATELLPSDDHRFDIIGIPELVAGPTTVWALAEFADTVAILHSLAEVCDLDVIDTVLGSSWGFSAAAQGQSAFVGRAGRKLWREVGTVVADRWDDVIDALDKLVATPEIDDELVAIAQAEIDTVGERRLPVDAVDEADEIDEEDEQPRDPDLEFWDDLGIDCISVRVGGRTGWTLRCYLDEAAVFLAEDDKILLYGSPAKLEKYLLTDGVENSLSELDAWEEIRAAIRDGEASVLAGPENIYVLDKLDEALLDGPPDVDADQASLAAELLSDAADFRGDGEVSVALSTATALGNLMRAVTQPDPERLPPSPPFDDEVAAWRALVASFAQQLTWK